MSIAVKTCSVEGCDRLCRARGYCYAHYRRVLAGSSNTSPVIRVTVRSVTGRCSVAGCEKAHNAKGLCKKHYVKQRRQFWAKYQRHPLSATYRSMLRRCRNPHYSLYKDYGGRGIKVCSKWLGPDGFKHFIEDMGQRPKGYTLDRVNNGGNYSPENCRWATRLQQNLNQRVNSNNTSGHTGVFFDKTQRRQWVAQLQIRGRKKTLGRFYTKEDAIAAREDGEEKYFKPLLEKV